MFLRTEQKGNEWKVLPSFRTWDEVTNVSLNTFLCF